MRYFTIRWNGGPKPHDNRPKETNRMKNWKTSLFGTGGVVAILADVLTRLTDGNVLTNPDWNVVLPGLLTALGLVFAGDAKAPPGPVVLAPVTPPTP